MSNTKEAVEWISISLIGLFALIANSWILRREYKKRQLHDITFTTKWLKIWSLLGIIAGIIWSFLVCMQYYPIVCQIGDQSTMATVVAQGVVIGFYQLSRLYYCFSQSKVYSNKGYSNGLFYVMFFIGSFLFINVVCFPWLITFAVDTLYACGINNNYQYFNNNAPISDHQLYGAWLGITLPVYLLWDFMTVLLYSIKALSFRKYNSKEVEVHKRIMSILSRILILTALYEICMALFIIVVQIDSLQNHRP
eukprot:527454_1